MNYTISDTLLLHLSEFVSAQIGLHFPKERWRDLERGIVSAAKEFRFDDPDACIQWLISSPLTKNQIEILASHLTVGETYFFREKKSLEALENNILPELIRSRKYTDRRIRIWSAGCCTGEEPYSIAMVLRTMLPDLDQWNISLLATDINPHFLRKALQGVYGEWSFRETPDWMKERYFKKKREHQYELLPFLKSMVTFSYLNFVEDSYPSLLTNTNAMDIIFCRNVLIYFAPEQTKKVVKKLYNCLMDGGWLVVSPSETSQMVFSEFNTVNLPGVIFYRKEKQQRSQAFSFPMEIHEAMPLEPEKVPYEVQEIDHILGETFFQKTPEALDESQAAVDQHDIYTEALMAYEHGRYAEAASTILAELSKHPTDPRLLTLLARIHANEGKLKEALEFCHKAINADKLSATNHFLLATILQEHGQIEDALNSLKKVLYLDQNYVLAHFMLGNLTWQYGRNQESRKHFQNALTLLMAHQPEEVLPESGGMSAGRVKEIIESMVQKELHE